MPRKKRDRLIQFPGGRSFEDDEGPEISPGMHAVLERIVFGKPFKTLHEANAFFDEMRVELMGAYGDAPPDPDSPAVLLARARTEDDHAAAVKLLKRAVSAARRQIPDELLEGPLDLEDLPETVAEWLDAKLMLAERLRLAGFHAKVVEHFEELYRLAPDAVMRQALVAAYLAEGNTEAAGPLLQVSESGAMKWLAAALYEHQRGDLAAASKALQQALKSNSFLRDYLSGKRSLPQEPNFSDKPGSRGEANSCIYRLMPAWIANPDSLGWLEQQVTR